MESIVKFTLYEMPPRGWKCLLVHVLEFVSRGEEAPPPRPNQVKVRTKRPEAIVESAHHLPEFYYGRFKLLVWSFMDFTTPVVIVVCKHRSSTPIFHTFVVSPLRLR